MKLHGIARGQLNKRYRCPLQPSPLVFNLARHLQQVENLTTRVERPLLVDTVARPRRTFGLPCKLSDRDACDWISDDYMAKVHRTFPKSIANVVMLAFKGRRKAIRSAKRAHFLVPSF